MTCSTDRYGATFVVAPSLGPPDCQVADFTDIQAAINALPPAGGKVFVKAGTYPQLFVRAGDWRCERMTSTGLTVVDALGH